MGSMSEIAEVHLVDDSAEFFAPVASDLVDGLVGQYQSMRARVERLGAMVDDETAGALQYFFDGNCRRERYMPSVGSVFQLPGAIAALNAGYWSKALSLTDVLDYMPQARRDEWNKTITEQTAPDFIESTVRDTLAGLLSMRSQFLAERVDGIFRVLSSDHVTNVPEGFSRRMIIAYAINSYGMPDHSRAGYINDLRAVVAKFMGRDEPKWRSTDDVLRTARGTPGEWLTLDGGALRIRVYKVGTAHLEVHPEMAYRLNQVLAHLHPLAIPAEFRTKPKKRAKEFQMMGKPLPFEVLAVLAAMRPMTEQISEWPARYRPLPNALRFDHSDEPKAARRQADEVLKAIGGVPQGKGLSYYQFDYHPGEVLGRIVASGCIPDQQSHQFYPTPGGLAEKLVAMADIGPEHTVLEPSAGQGGLADLLPKEQTTCVEIAALHCQILRAKGYVVHEADFLAWADLHWTGGLGFDRIVMNPPFSEGRARAHTEAAYTLLKPGGVLVAILPAGMRGKDFLPGCEWSHLHENQFAGTSVDVVLVRVQKEAA